MTTRKHNFLAGNYWIGDPCYIFSDKTWDKLIKKTGCFGLDEKQNLLLKDFDDGLFQYRGKKCFIGSTKYGDGCFLDERGNAYLVDSGSLGVVPVSVCLVSKLPLGNVFIMEKDFEVWEDDGNLHFGNHVVFTGDTIDDDDIEYEEEVCFDCGEDMDYCVCDENEDDE